MVSHLDPTVVVKRDGEVNFREIQERGLALTGFPIECRDTQHDDTQHKDAQYNDKNTTLGISDTMC